LGELLNGLGRAETGFVDLESETGDKQGNGISIRPKSVDGMLRRVGETSMKTDLLGRDPSPSLLLPFLRSTTHGLFLCEDKEDLDRVTLLLDKRDSENMTEVSFAASGPLSR
jgi:hypothetical protein